MRELDRCLQLAKTIKEKQELIIELKAKTMHPKSQILSDMPKGGSIENEIETYLIKLERLENYVKGLKEKRGKCWNRIVRKLTACNITDPETIKLLFMRFYAGKAWEKCNNEMREHYPHSKWNLNKCFRVYRAVLVKIDKKDD